jgi:hypothetical protein
MPFVRVLICVRRPPADVPLPGKGSQGGARRKLSFQPRCEGMGTSVSLDFHPSCRSLLARLLINASRTLCALHPILPTSFASTASPLSCPRIILPTPENRNVRSARNRSGNREPTKSPTSTSALPGHHGEANLVPPVAARALAGDQMYQMQVRTSPSVD